MGTEQMDGDQVNPCEDPPGDLLDTSAAGPAAIRGSLIRAGGYVGNALIALLGVSLLIRHIGVVEFGHYVTVVSLVTLAATLSDAGLTTVGIREYAVRMPEERDRLMANLLGLRLALTVIGVLGAASFAIVAGYERRLVVGTLIAGAGIVLTVLQGTYGMPLTAMLRLGTVTVLDMGRQLLQTALTVALVIAGGTLLDFLALPILVGVVMLLITIRIVRGSMPRRPRFERTECLPLLRSVVPIAIAVAVAAVYFRLALILMSLIASAAQTGFYATSYRVIEVIVLLPGLLVGAAFPLLARAARDDADRLRYAVQRLSDAMVILGGFVFVSLVLGADAMIHLLAGGTSDASVPVLEIQAVAVAVNFIATPWNFALLSLARYRDVLWVSLIGVAVLVVAALVLVPALDAQGAALAVVAGDTTQGVLICALARRRLPAVKVSRRVALAVLAGSGLSLLTLGLDGLPSVGRVAVGAVAYVVVIFAARAVPEELVSALRSRNGR